MGRGVRTTGLGSKLEPAPCDSIAGWGKGPGACASAEGTVGHRRGGPRDPTPSDRPGVNQGTWVVARSFRCAARVGSRRHRFSISPLPEAVREDMAQRTHTKTPPRVPRLPKGYHRAEGGSAGLRRGFARWLPRPRPGKGALSVARSALPTTRRCSAQYRHPGGLRVAYSLKLGWSPRSG